MENLLLVLDEIDDVFSTIGLVWRPIVSFLAAVALFVATGFLFITLPVVVEVMAFCLVTAGLIDFIRQRRVQQRLIATAQE